VLQAVDPYKISEIFGGVWVGISGKSTTLLLSADQHTRRCSTLHYTKLRAKLFTPMNGM
jgi:hypothetical protein